MNTLTKIDGLQIDKIRQSMPEIQNLLDSLHEYAHACLVRMKTSDDFLHLRELSKVKSGCSEVLVERKGFRSKIKSLWNTKDVDKIKADLLKAQKQADDARLEFIVRMSVFSSCISLMAHQMFLGIHHANSTAELKTAVAISANQNMDAFVRIETRLGAQIQKAKGNSATAQALFGIADISSQDRSKILKRARIVSSLLEVQLCILLSAHVRHRIFKLQQKLSKKPACFL